MQSWVPLTLKWIIRDPGRPTQDQVLGNFQPSLRDYSLAHADPGLHPGATLSRPYGTQFGEGSYHADSKALNLHTGAFWRV